MVKNKNARFRTADRRQLRESGKQLKRYVATSPGPYKRARIEKFVQHEAVCRCQSFKKEMVGATRLELATS